MIVVTGHFRLPAERTDVARPAMERVIAANRAEEGCLSYSYAQDIRDPELFRVTETWEDEAALSAHFKTPHMIRWREERGALGMTERTITAHHIGKSRKL